MNDDEIVRAYSKLRDLAYEDPLETKGILLKLISENPQFGLAVMHSSTDERGARFRQIAARALPQSQKTPEVKLVLESWLQFERDEFAVSAIRDALLSEASLRTKKKSRSGMSNLVELEGTYKYVSSRLRHRVLNALPSTGLTITNLKKVVIRSLNPSEAAEASGLLDRLYGHLIRLERAVEFDEDERYFQLGAIDLGAWLRSHQIKFCREFGTVTFSIEGSVGGDGVKVAAIPFCLETAFTNLWKNSLDELDGSHCSITMICENLGKILLVTLHDNGSGLRESDVQKAFEYQFSSKSKERGRGHMEVRDAMGRMGGSARVASTNNGYRVQLSFLVVR